MPATAVCIGVGGASGAGKTTLVKRLAERFSHERVIIVEQDAYYFDRSGIPPDERDSLNFDEPGAFEVSLLVRQVVALKSGRAVEAPIYDFSHHIRTGYRSVKPARIVIVEGILALFWPELRRHYDLSVFVEQDQCTCLERRIDRDVRERGRTRESVLTQYEQTVRPMFRRYVEPSRVYATHLVRGDDRGCDQVLGLEAEVARLLLALPAKGAEDR